MRISDWSSDVCSSDLLDVELGPLGGAELDRTQEHQRGQPHGAADHVRALVALDGAEQGSEVVRLGNRGVVAFWRRLERVAQVRARVALGPAGGDRVAHHLAAVLRSEEHTSELQSLMRLSYAVFCLKKKTT